MCWWTVTHAGQRQKCSVICVYAWVSEWESESDTGIHMSNSMYSSIKQRFRVFMKVDIKLPELTWGWRNALHQTHHPSEDALTRSHPIPPTRSPPPAPVRRWSQSPCLFSAATAFPPPGLTAPPAASPGDRGNDTPLCVLWTLAVGEVEAGHCC